MGFKKTKLTKRTIGKIFKGNITFLVVLIHALKLFYYFWCNVLFIIPALIYRVKFKTPYDSYVSTKNTEYNIQNNGNFYETTKFVQQNGNFWKTK